MLSIFVCDDERAFADLLEDKLTRVFGELGVETDIRTFCSPSECLAAVREGDAPGAIFLDIDMPGVSGFEIADRIRKERVGSLVIFVSAKQELVFESFDYHPFSFIRKNSGGDFDADIRKVCGSVVNATAQKKPLEIRDVYAGTVFVAVENITHVRSDNHYLEYYAVGRDRPIKERGTIKEAARKLSEFGFIRPHGRYVVNTEHVGFFNPKINRIVLDTKESVPVSRSLRDSAYEDYKKRKRLL